MVEPKTSCEFIPRKTKQYWKDFWKDVMKDHLLQEINGHSLKKIMEMIVNYNKNNLSESLNSNNHHGV
uniref:Uncharacterized protein n=1 Tax=Tetranychus urticae TaxID=32264 RepID=T1K1B8_TETUR